MENNGKQDAWAHQIGNAELGRNVKVAKTIMLLGICVNHGAKHTINGASNRTQTHNFHKMIKPVSSLVKRKISLMTQNGQQSGEERQRVHFQSLHGHTRAGIVGPHFVVQQSKAKATHEGRIGQQKREIARRQEVIHQQGHRQEASP